MEIKSDDLKAFCAVDDYRDYLEQPWSDGGKTYATNGHILIQLNSALEDVPAYEKNKYGVDHENIAKIFGRRKALEMKPLARVAYKQDKINIECPVCRGDGEVGFTCEDGNFEVSELSELCPMCCVSGEVVALDDKPLAWLGYFPCNRNYLNKISQLPAVKIERLSEEEAAKTGCVFFEFEGGHGVLMGRRTEGKERVEADCF